MQFTDSKSSCSPFDCWGFIKIYFINKNSLQKRYNTFFFNVSDKCSEKTCVRQIQNSELMFSTLSPRLYNDPDIKNGVQ